MTMVHPEEGQLQAFLDGELSLDSANVVERHLMRCPACRDRVAGMNETEERVASALGLLDPVTDMDAGRWEARRRRAARRSMTHRKRLVAAAVTILFLGAGAAAAMPGSPIRAWFGGDAPTPEAAVANESRGAALAIQLVDGTARVDLDQGAVLELRVGSGDRMRVEAPPSGAFDTGAGWVRVTGHGTVAPVRLELPDPPHGVEVVVGGVVRLQIRDGVMHLAEGDPVPVPGSEWLRVDLDRGALEEEGGPDGE